MPDDFEFSITNADGTTASFSLVDNDPYDITQYFDKPGECRLKVDKDSHSISDGSTLEARYKGIVKFRGYIIRPDDKEDYTEVVASEQQKLLEARYLQTYSYPAGTALNTILSSSEPTTYPGLLYLANSLILPGSFLIYPPYTHIYRLAGAGTSSRFGVMTKLYQTITLLTQVGNVASMTAGTWYQSATDLYVWTTTGKDPRYYLMSVPNVFDTYCRLGTISLGTSSFTAPFRTTIGVQVATEVTRCINSIGLEWQWQHKRDGYSYLNAAATIGRGSESAPVERYYE